MEANLSEYITEYYEEEKCTNWDKYYEAIVEKEDEEWEDNLDE